MGMRKIFFGTIVFFSLAFLAACGGGSGSSGSAGSDGAAGAAGADGAAGATGSITVFSDANLLASFNGAAGAVPGATPTAVPLDNGSVIGKISGQLLVTGFDNLTPSSPNRYFQYTETSAGVKTAIVAQSGATAETGPNTMFDTDDDGIFDTRVLGGGVDNLTNDLTDFVLPDDFAADGVSKTTGYISVCPGNMAGDGTCSKVKAPAYDRGIHAASVARVITANGAGADLAASIAFVGSSFHLLTDNATGAGDLADGSVVAHRFTHSKAGWATARTSDNSSSAAGRVLGEDLMSGVGTISCSGGVGQTCGVGLAGYGSIGGDNGTLVSNLLTRGSNVWFASAHDNNELKLNGDNVSFGYRVDGGSGYIVDNGTKIASHKIITARPQIAESGDGMYLLLGSSLAVSAFIVRDNETITVTDNVTVGTADTWCSTSTGGASTRDAAGNPAAVSDQYAVIVSDNLTAAGTAGIWVHQVFDNGTVTAKISTANSGSAVGDPTGGTSGHVDLENCAVTHLAGTFYVALTDEDAVGGDNVSVWKSDNLTGWTQIGEDITMLSDTPSIAITTIGGTASDNAVWVAVNDGGNVKLLHYEDIAGGTNYAWNIVGTVLTGATTSGAAAGITVATDNSSVVAVSAIVSAEGTVGFWYNQ